MRAQIRTCARTQIFGGPALTYNLLGVRAPSLATGTGGEASVYARTMEWTNEKILLFIQAIETHPVLWDTAKESPVPRYLSVIASLIETETLFRK